MCHCPQYPEDSRRSPYPWDEPCEAMYLIWPDRQCCLKCRARHCCRHWRDEPSHGRKCTTTTLRQGDPVLSKVGLSKSVYPVVHPCRSVAKKFVATMQVLASRRGGAQQPAPTCGASEFLPLGPVRARSPHLNQSDARASHGMRHQGDARPARLTTDNAPTCDCTRIGQRKTL